MGYRIFYSYQSDIDSKLNHKFIREAINIAISKITEFTIEPLIEGFYGIGGNAPLAKTMFDQSKKSDIFIGDVTFTSSKIWQSNAIHFHEDAKSYLMEFEKPINLKPAPNPNVLLETGYSWALKSHNRTILVMNKAFGNPVDLPVDMDGLRWPILYNLDNERADKPSKFKKELDKLSEALTLAIIDSIKSDIAYQLKMLKPFENHSLWSRIHTFPILLTEKFKGKLIELRESILNYKGPIRIAGNNGVGKSRLVFEVFQKNDDLEFDQANESILYYSLLGSNYNDINNAVSFLVHQNQPKIVVVDDCPFDVHKKLATLFKGSNLKLVTITNKISEDVTLYFEEEIATEINKKIIENYYHSIGKSIDFEISNFSLEKTISIFENIQEREISSKTSVEILKNILGEENLKNEALEFLQIISLFGFLGYTNDYSYEINELKDVFFSNKSMEEIQIIIRQLIAKKLLTIKGDSIVSIGFDEELVADWLLKDNNYLEEQILKISKLKFFHKFIDKITQVIIKKNNGKIKDLLFESDKLLNNVDFVNSEAGELLLNILTEKFPKEVLKVMSKKISKL